MMPKAPRRPPKPKAKQLSATQRGYGVEHRRFRAEQLSWRVVCECCDKRPTTEMHHLKPLRGDRYDEDKLDPHNVLAVCGSCHTWITSAVEPYMPAPLLGKFVVFGRPGAGKSTYALKMAFNQLWVGPESKATDIWDWDVKRPEYDSDAQCTHARRGWAIRSRDIVRPAIMVVNTCQDAYDLGQIMAARLVYVPCDENTRQERLRERNQ